MAARGLVNGRGPSRSDGRDSAKRVVSDTDTPKSFPEKTDKRIEVDRDVGLFFVPKRQKCQSGYCYGIVALHLYL